VQAHQYYVQEQHTEKPNAMTITRRTAAFDSIAPSLATQIKKLVDEKVYPGISVAVILDGRSIWSFQAGTQHLETNERITERTCFRLASITKTFTALAVLGLRDEGRLHLDEPIAKTVRQALTWRSHTSDSAPITWRHLLTHTSGLPRVGPLDFTRTDKGPTKTRLEHLFKDIESLNSPGVETRYSNLGYAVLGLAISKRAGRSYEEEIHRRFLKPLSMTDAGFSRSDCDKTATGYARRRSVRINRRHIALAHLSNGRLAATKHERYRTNSSFNA
jgi:CubicO group peptidase (beta-lactamase class C family)